MDVASLPAETAESSTPAQVKLTEQLVDQALLGRNFHEIAELLYPTNNKANRQRRRAWVRKARKFVATNDKMQLALAEATRAEILFALPAASRALAKRAARGRPDAIKLLFEATGFHNPRVKHEHSGDIKITLDIPRPGGPGKSQESQPPAELDIPEADVVEE